MLGRRQPHGVRARARHLRVRGTCRGRRRQRRRDPVQRTFTVVLPPAEGGGGGGGGGGDIPADTKAPDTAIDSGPKRKSFKRKAKFAFSATEAGSRFECQLDQGEFEPCTSPATFKVKPGRHRLEVRAIDAAGNLDPTPAAHRWRVRKRR